MDLVTGKFNGTGASQTERQGQTQKSSEAPPAMFLQSPPQFVTEFEE